MAKEERWAKLGKVPERRLIERERLDKRVLLSNFDQIVPLRVYVCMCVCVWRGVYVCVCVCVRRPSGVGG